MPTYQLGVQMVDAYGRPVSKALDIVAADPPAGLTLAGSIMTDLAPITGARILSYTLKVRVPYTDSVTAGANRDAGATISVRTADNEKANFSIPAPEASIFNADGTVDLTDGGFAAYLANYLSGAILVDDGEVVTEVISGKLDS